MIEVNLGSSIEQFGSGVPAFSIIEELGLKAKEFIGFKCDKTGEIYDLHSYIRGPIAVSPIKTKTPEHLQMIRHDSANILANSLFELYGSKAVDIKITENGFYVDFYNKSQLSEKHFTEIEKSMKSKVSKSTKFELHSLNKEEALELFNDLENEFIVKTIENSSAECFMVHGHGSYRILSDGPRSLSSSSANHFKLLTISGSSWDHGDEKLQRIHGTCWYSKELLENYLVELEENLKWDHRVLGNKMSLFHIDPEISSGMVFWLPNGIKILNKVKQYLQSVLLKHDYNEISTPVVMNADLWEKSGHTEMFKENMMFMKLHDEEYALKPMSCPGHISVFKLGNKSYRDLPYKLSEFGMCHRYEPSGALHGLMRARSFTQDDAHVFCSEEQIEEVIVTFCAMLKEIYKKFGFEDVLVCLATRPEKYIGELSSWDDAETALLEAAKKSNLSCKINQGEGAFYGPKLEFSIKDKRGHVWQCGTIQVDFSLAKRLDATYANENSEQKTPVVVHHAVLGSLERFLGILLENTTGLLPVWMHPYPLVIVPIKEEQNEYAKQVQAQITSINVNSCIDNTNQSLGYKIRHWSEKRAHFFVILGKKEESSQKVTLRSLDGKEESLTLGELLSKIGSC